jgi:hypothetical protein
MLRAGFLTNAARITGVLSKKELIGVFFTVLVNHQGFGGTVNRTKGAARALFFIDEEHPVILWQKAL